MHFSNIMTFPGINYSTHLQSHPLPAQLHQQNTNLRLSFRWQRHKGQSTLLPLFTHSLVLNAVLPQSCCLYLKQVPGLPSHISQRGSSGQQLWCWRTGRSPRCCEWSCLYCCYRYLLRQHTCLYKVATVKPTLPLRATGPFQSDTCQDPIITVLAFDLAYSYLVA